MDLVAPPGQAAALARFLGAYSTEVTTRDRRSLEAAGDLMPPGAEVFIAALPKEDPLRVVAAAAQLRKAGLIAVPHLVARNLQGRAAFAELLKRLVGEAGVDRALVLGGDRDQPVGDLRSSLDLLETGLLEQNGIQRIFVGCYPESHPRISCEGLSAALSAKLAYAERSGAAITLISQFCFDAEPILMMAYRLRVQGVTAPLRVGIAGPASRTSLLRYALICGVGPSIRALSERQDLARAALTSETPDRLLEDLAAADPRLGISGVHFFTFGSLSETAAWTKRHRQAVAALVYRRR